MGKKAEKIAQLEQDNALLSEQGERLSGVIGMLAKRLNNVIEMLANHVKLREAEIARLEELVKTPVESYLTVCKADRDMLMKQNGQLQTELNRLQDQYQSVVESTQVLEEEYNRLVDDCFDDRPVGGEAMWSGPFGRDVAATLAKGLKYEDTKDA